MKKISFAVYMALMGLLVLSVSGCGGGSSSSFVSSPAPAVKEVAVLTSPAFEINSDYLIFKGALLGGMDGAKYYVADTGSEASKTTLNLGFAEELGNESLVFVKDGSGQVVFAYDPSGSGSKTSGTVTRLTEGRQQGYNGLTISPAFFTSLNADTSNAKTIILNGSTAVYEGSAVPVYDYVWHSDPDHRDEYYTEGLNGTDELTESQVKSRMAGDVFIAHDIRYMINTLDFTGTARNDNENEYAAYYSSSVQEEVAAELGSGFEGPYIFATLPGSMGGAPGGDTRPTFPANPTNPDTRPSLPTTPTNPDTMPSPPDTPTNPDTSPSTPTTPTNPNTNPSTPTTPANPNTDPSSPVETPETPITPSPETDTETRPASFTDNGASYNSQIASTISLMTHSAQEAYNNPVLHITKAGTYELKGSWHGQIWIDVGDGESDKAAIILNGVDVSCDVAPAIVFREAYEPGPDDEDIVKATSLDVGKNLIDTAGAMVVIADDTVNNFTGSNVYRMLRPQKKKDSVTAIDGSDVSQQKKRYKMDGAFYSFVSLAMAGGEKANGVLNVKSASYEGLDTELHMTLESGTVSVYAPDDGMNFNEDDTSVFTMLGGNLTVTSTGGDGIDSNGYIVILGGTLDVTAARDSSQLNAQAEGPLDADCGVYMAEGVSYSHRAYDGSSQPATPTTPATPATPSTPETPETPETPSNETPETPSDETPGTPETPETPSDETPGTPELPADETPETPSDETPGLEPEVPDTSSQAVTLTNSAGTTEIIIGTGSSQASIIADKDEAIPRGISTSDKVFRLRRKVNTFSGITDSR